MNAAKGMRLIALISFLLSSGLSGCSTSSRSTTPVDARSGTVVSKNFRMAINFDGDKRSTIFQNGSAVEFGVSNMSGGAEQSVNSGQLPVILNQAVFNGPQQIRNEFDFAFYDLSWRFRNNIDDKFGLEMSVGAGFVEVDVKSSSTTQSAYRKFASNGARVEYGLHYFLSRNSSVQARAKLYWAPVFNHPGVHGMGMLEVVYATAIRDNFIIRAGISRWKLSGYDETSFRDAQNIYRPSRSDIELDFFGPTIDLNLEF